MLSSVKVSAPKLKSRLEHMQELVDGGWHDDAQKVGERIVEFLQRNTPRSEGVGSQEGEHIADGWELYTIGGNEKSGRGLLMVVYNRFTTTKAGEILPSARLQKVSEEKKSDYTLMHILEYGSRPHRIHPFKAMVLHFIGADGKDVFTREVNHPGTKPTGMIRLARAHASEWFKEFVKRWAEKWDK